MSAPARRVKVRRTFARNRFYELVLLDWKQSIEDRNFRSVLSRALINLKAYPLSIAKYEDLKNVRGIGDQIARKLEGAWDVFCSQNLTAPTVKVIEQMKKGDFLQFLNSANFLEQRCGPQIITASKADNAGGDNDCRTKEIQEVDVENVKVNDKMARKRPPKMMQPKKTPKKSAFMNANDIGIGGLPHSVVDKVRCSKVSRKRDDKETVGGTCDYAEPMNAIITDDVNGPECSVEQNLRDSSIIFHPSTFSSSRVILIIDNRECVGARKFQNMCTLFQKKGICYELRSLSVGDYLWIMRMCDGTEMVMDYIVERKTLDDLWSSIKQKRYEEQKQRLTSAGISNVVYIVEGSRIPEPALEQALVTTHVENRFLVYRTSNFEHTSFVLLKITERLIERASTQELIGISFEDFQKISKKNQHRSVRDVFLRQLTVCPQISVQKAQLITDRFPSFASLTSLYASLPKEHRAAALSNNVPGISKIASANMAKFYAEI